MPLKNDKTIIIKRADKGSGVTAFDREDYLKVVRHQLSGKDIIWR